jgi:hypothetical protein
MGAEAVIAIVVSVCVILGFAARVASLWKKANKK